MTRTDSNETDDGSGAIRGLLLTVGGTPEPMIYAVQHTRPSAVVFVCSEQTQASVVEIKSRLADALRDSGSPTYKTLTVDNPADLIDCHRRVAEGLTYLREHCKLPRDQIRIDFTGGTKAMSAAAVLAAAPDGYRFSYVSGQARDKNGVGVVLTGSEELSLPENPWTVLEEAEIRRLLQMAALGQWAAAIESVDVLLLRAASQGRPVFLELKKVLRGLAHWDRFEHGNAWQAWDRGNASEVLVKLATAGGYQRLVVFAEKVGGMKCVLGQLANQPDRKSGGPDPMVVDMIANGDRQAARGNCDEAALRYYRAVELCGARRLRLLFKIDNNATPTDKVPSPLREEFLRRKGDPPKGLWKLGQRDCVQLLAALDDSLGQHLLDQFKSNRIDAQARNENWLIHGQQHVSQSSCESFRTAVLDALDISPEEIPAWPDFRP